MWQNVTRCVTGLRKIIIIGIAGMRTHDSALNDMTVTSVVHGEGAEGYILGRVRGGGGSDCGRDGRSRGSVSKFLR